MLTQSEKDALLDAIKIEIDAKVALKRADARSQDLLAAWRKKNPDTPTTMAPPDVLLEEERRELGRATVLATQHRDALILAAVQKGLR